MNAPQSLDFLNAVIQKFSCDLEVIAQVYEPEDIEIRVDTFRFDL